MDCPCSNFYESMHYINVQTQKYHIVKTTSQSAAQMGEYEIIDDFGGHAKCMAEKMCMESQLEETAAFIDLNTLDFHICFSIADHQNIRGFSFGIFNFYSLRL